MDKLEELGYSKIKMFKKIDFQGLNYKDLDRFSSHDLKRDEMHSFYQTFDFLNLIKKWPSIIGPKLATVTSPLRLNKDSLIIVTKHSAYSEQISYLSEELKKNIFGVFPELRPVIKKLVYQTQEKFFEQQKEKEPSSVLSSPRLHPQSPMYKILKLEADRLFGDIPDEELKQMMISIYLQSR